MKSCFEFIGAIALLSMLVCSIGFFFKVSKFSPPVDDKKIRKGEIAKSEIENRATSEPALERSCFDAKRLINLVSAERKITASVLWKKSRVESGWVGVYHLPVGKNEVSFSFTGPNSEAITSITIESEIYNIGQEAQTIVEGSKWIEKLFPECPGTILESFRNRRRKVESDDLYVWRVKKNNHNAGYDLVFTAKTR